MVNVCALRCRGKENREKQFHRSEFKREREREGEKERGEWNERQQKLAHCRCGSQTCQSNSFLYSSYRNHFCAAFGSVSKKTLCQWIEICVRTNRRSILSSSHHADCQSASYRSELWGQVQTEGCTCLWHINPFHSRYFELGVLKWAASHLSTPTCWFDVQNKPSIKW